MLIFYIRGVIEMFSQWNNRMVSSQRHQGKFLYGNLSLKFNLSRGHA